MTRTTTALACAFLTVAAGCGGESGGQNERTVQEQPGAEQAPAPRVAGEPEELSFAPALEVNLDSMTRSESGLYFQVLEEGSGETAGEGDSVSVHYTGWLANGRKFDSSRDRDEPFGFTVGAGRVIAGWDEGVQGMRVGERRKLVVPPDLGYGSRGAGRAIPPNATLVFDVELLQVH